MHNLSLVVFTLLIQISVGIFGSTLVHHWTNKDGIAHIPFMILSICLGLTAVGLISAMTHLGNPGKARHSVSNITGSWLSREIIAVNLLIGVTGLVWVLTWAGYSKGLFFFETASFILGIVAIWTMSQVYRLRTVPVWNHRSTPLDFFGTALLSGGVVSGILDVVISDQATGPSVIFLICSGLGLVFKITAISLTISIQKRSKNLFWYTSSKTKSIGQTVNGIVLSCLYTLGFVLFITANFGWTGQPLLFLIPSFGITLLTEIWHRFRFYDSFCRIGL